MATYKQQIMGMSNAAYRRRVNTNARRERYGEYSTDTELAREIIINALTFALSEETSAGLEKVARDYTPSKTRRVRKYVVKMAHDIFLKYGHTNNLDMSGHPIVRHFERELNI
jgi:hypothetical protein